LVVTGHSLDILARIPLWKDGLDYRHGTGHGIGSYLNVHEGLTIPYLYLFPPVYVCDSVRPFIVWCLLKQDHI